MQKLSFSCTYSQRSTEVHRCLCPVILVSVIFLNTLMDLGPWPLASVQWHNIFHLSSLFLDYKNEGKTFHHHPPIFPVLSRERCPSDYLPLKSRSAACPPKVQPMHCSLEDQPWNNSACETCISQIQGGLKNSVYISFTSLIVKLLTLHLVLEYSCDGH